MSIYSPAGGDWATGKGPECLRAGKYPQMEPPDGCGRCGHVKVARAGAKRDPMQWGKSIHSNELMWTAIHLLLAVLSGRAARMSTNFQGQSYDARIYSLCAPWKGQRGDPYSRVFKPMLMNALDGITDDYANLREHAEGVDPGGNNGGPVHVGVAAEVRKSENAYRARASKLKSLIVKHVEVPSIRVSIESACAAVRAGAALPYGAPAGTSLGQMAMIVIDAFGVDPNTGLARNSREQLWSSLSMRTVGYTPESMIELVTLIGL